MQIQHELKALVSGAKAFLGIVLSCTVIIAILQLLCKDYVLFSMEKVR